MKIAIASDLHVEGRELLRLPETDLAIIAGDWANGMTIQREGYSSLECNAPIAYVAGNHDYYGLDIDVAPTALRKAAEASGLIFLDRDRVEIGGWTILGCTLWTDFALHREPGQSKMNCLSLISDFRLITCGGKFVTPEQIQELFWRDFEWLHNELKQCDPKNTIVVTHFGPHPSCTHEFYKVPEWRACNPYFTSDTGLVERYQPSLWIFGHTHMACDKLIGRTRLICNPRGYLRESAPPEGTGWRSDFVIDLG